MNTVDKDIYILLSNIYLSYIDTQSLRYCNKYLNSLPMPSIATIFKRKLYELFDLDPNISISDIYGNMNEYEAEKNYISIELNEIKKNCNKNIEMLYEKLNGSILYNRMKNLRYGIVYELFKHNDTISSGPFMLDCLYNTDNHSVIHSINSINISKNDLPLTIFMNPESCLNFVEYLDIIGMFIDTSILYKRVGVCYHDEIKNIYKPCFNIVNISDYSVTKFIDVYYDLDIHKVQYDGKNLKVSDWEKLIYKYDYFTYGNRYISSVICETGYMCAKDYIELYIKHAETRIEKYSNIGFNIQLHPQIDEIEESIKEITICNNRKRDMGKCVSDVIINTILNICDILDEHPLI